MRAALWALATLPAFADPWIRVQAGTVTLYSDATARSATAAAQRLDRLDAAFRRLYPEVAERPVQVLWFARGEDYQPFARGRNNAGISYSGPLGEWIIAAATAPEPQRVLTHELGHLILDRMLAGARPPAWLAEGFAEVYSTLEAGDREIEVGAPIPAHVATLRQRPWAKSGELDADHELLYPQGWALAREVVLREPEKFRKFLETNEIPAASETRAREFAPLSRRLSWSRALTPASQTRASEAGVRRLSADLLFAAGRAEEARRVLARVAKSFPDSEEAALARAILEREKTGPRAARPILEAAIARGIPEDRAVHLEYIALLEELRESSEVVEAAMRTAAARHPDLTSIDHRLGQRLAAAGKWEEALERLQRAAEAEPRNFTYWHAYAWALRERGREAEVRRAAGHLRRLAGTPREVEMAAALENEPAAAPPPGTPRPLPARWRQPEGDSAAEGHLVNFVCSDPPEFEVESEGRRERFRITDPGRVAIRGRQTFDFPCGAQRLRVRIEYQRETRVVTAIEVLPAGGR